MDSLDNEDAGNDSPESRKLQREVGQSEHSSRYSIQDNNSQPSETVSNIAFYATEGYNSNSSISGPPSAVAPDNDDSAYLLYSRKRMGLLSGYKGMAILFLAGVLILIVGVLIGLLGGRTRKFVREEDWSTMLSDYNASLSDLLQKRVDPNFISRELKRITSNLHQAGTPNNLKLAHTFRDNWLKWGWPSVTLDNYTVTLSQAEDAGVLLELIKPGSGVEDQVLISFNTSQFNGTLPVYHAFSPSGYAKADYVFVNYARPSDLDYLQSRNISICSGRIIIARLGFGSRGSKISTLTKHCRTEAPPGGLLIYPDPEEFAPDQNKVWPDGWWLPGTAPVFGNVRTNSTGGGDMATPGLPSLDGIYRLENLTEMLASFPIQPISYNDAKLLLNRLAGPDVPPEWNTSLARKIGPSGTYEIRLNVTTRLVQRPITNVIGILPGTEEPDRYVLLGNHHDAWALGASDPGSGSVIVQEIARVLGNAYVNMGFRPRRSIMLASWDAEEQSLIGSTEFTQRFDKEMEQRLVAYLNIDCPIKGNWSFNARSDALLAGPAIASSMRVRLDNNGSLYEDWLEKMPAVPGHPEDGPKISALLGGSDHITFNYKLGIPAIYPEYRYKEMLPSMPAYHTTFDTFDMMQDYIDPGMSHHALVGRFLIDLLLRLSDSRILPFSLDRFGQLLSESLKLLKKRTAKLAPFQRGEITTDYIEKEVSNLVNAAARFTNFIESLNATVSSLQLRRINDIIQNVLKSFISSHGLPKRPYYKNILIAPSASNSYRTAVFIGVQDALTYAESNTTSDWSVVKRQISVLVTCLRHANQLLQGGFIGLNDLK